MPFHKKAWKAATTVLQDVADASNIDIDPRTSDVNIPSVTLPDVGIPNVPTPNIGETLLTGANKISEGLTYTGEQFAAGSSKVHALGNKLAQGAMKIFSGTGMYADEDESEDPVPGPTGFEAASAQKTLLTGQRTKGKGREYHAGSGSAGRV